MISLRKSRKAPTKNGAPHQEEESERWQGAVGLSDIEIIQHHPQSTGIPYTVTWS